MVLVHRVRACSVCVDRGSLLCVRLRDPLTRVARLFPPGGALEAGESAAAAARRETREETGYDVAVDDDSEHVVEYPFVWAGLEIACTTHFFRARLITPRDQPAAVNDAAYHEGAFWLPLASVGEAFGYSREIHGAVEHVLAQSR